MTNKEIIDKWIEDRELRFARIVHFDSHCLGSDGYATRQKCIVVCDYDCTIISLHDLEILRAAIKGDAWYMGLTVDSSNKLQLEIDIIIRH